MSSSSFTLPEDDSVPTTGSTRPLDDDGYPGYDPQRFDSFTAVDSEAVDDVFAAAQPLSPPSIYTESNGQGFGGGSDDPILPSPSEMLPEEGFALREWRRCGFEFHLVLQLND